jgi:hypothetical protein
MDKKRRRLSYLLRVWQAEENGVLVWRASLESVFGPVRCLASAGSGRPGERRGFASLGELHAFLEKETALDGRERPLH